MRSYAMTSSIVDPRTNTSSFMPLEFLTKRTVLYTVLSSAGIVLACPELAFAYVDPSVVTYAVQAIAGVAVAISAVVGVAFRKVRKKLFEVFNIDENARKEVDPTWDLVESNRENIGKDYATVSSMSQGRHARAEGESEAAVGGLPSQVDMRWPRRFVCGLLVAAFATITIVVLPPAEILAGAGTDLLFTVEDVVPVMARFALVATVAIAITVSLFNGRLYAVLLAVVFAVSLCSYLQALFMNAGLPAANGMQVDWSSFNTDMEVTGAIWVAVFAAFIVFAAKKVRLSRAVFSIISLCLIVVQTVGVCSLFVNSEDSGLYKSDVVVTDDGLFSLSDKNNIVVFILDMYDTRDLDKALEQDPELLVDMSGFTWYHDASEVFLPTKYAVPYLLSHELPKEDEAVSTYLWRRYSDSSFIRDLYRTGYSLGVYSTNLHLGSLKPEAQNELFLQYCENAHQLEHAALDDLGTVKMMMQCAFYREMPWALKPYFRFYTDDINTECRSKTDIGNGSLEYVTDDASYYQELVNVGLSIDDEYTTGAFRFIHLLGAHYPHTLDENAVDVGEANSNRVLQARGSMHIVSEYIQQMKELGVYEDAAIVITADHGDWKSWDTLPGDIVAPILLVKEPGVDGFPVRISEARVSHEDFAASVLNWAESPFVWRYGTPFNEIEDEERVRDSYLITNAGGHVLEILKYQIDGSVLDLANWHYTGTYWQAMESEDSTRDVPYEIMYGGTSAYY